MSAFTPEQWAAAGEAALRAYVPNPSDADVAEARAFAVVLALGDPDREAVE